MVGKYCISKNGCLSLHARGLIPQMAMKQATKAKVWPVKDYREINQYVDPFTANADVCVKGMREWQQQGVNMALVDLWKAYIQILIHKTPWPFQTVIVKGTTDMAWVWS